MVWSSCVITWGRNTGCDLRVAEEEWQNSDLYVASHVFSSYVCLLPLLSPARILRTTTHLLLCASIGWLKRWQVLLLVHAVPTRIRSPMTRLLCLRAVLILSSWKGPCGKYGYFSPATLWVQLLITLNLKNPKKLIHVFLNYLLTAGDEEIFIITTQSLA